MVLRKEAGMYEVRAEYLPDGEFEVAAESVSPVTLTLRVEDAWMRLPEAERAYSYAVAADLDAPVRGRRELHGVAPDARIFFDMNAAAKFRFTKEKQG